MLRRIVAGRPFTSEILDRVVGRFPCAARVAVGATWLACGQHDSRVALSEAREVSLQSWDARHTEKQVDFAQVEGARAEA